VAPLMGQQLLEDGVAAVRQAWADAGRADAGRAGAPRIATGRYFSLGPNADVVADNYIRHYYGDAGFDMARADTLTSPDQIHHELDYLAKRGVTDLVLYPSSTDPDQIRLLVEALGPWPPERRSAQVGPEPDAMDASAEGWRRRRAPRPRSVRLTGRKEPRVRDDDRGSALPS
jgi:hypothetical protein